MEELQKNKCFNIFKWIFIVVSTIHIMYATLSLRGLYEDGCFYMIMVLNHLADNLFKFQIDWEHPRFMILALMQLPVILAYKIFCISDKNILMKIFCFAQFTLPLLILWWNYNLSKRTGRIDIFFWSLFTYGAINLTFSIFSVVESLIGSMFHFVLWNYLASKINYTKKDIFYIISLIIIMFGTYEYVIMLGIIFFTASIYYASSTQANPVNKRIKLLIGAGALLSSIFNIIFMLKTTGEASEIARFLKEAYDFFPYIFNLNTLFTIVTVAVLIFLTFKKEKLSTFIWGVLIVLYGFIFIKLFQDPILSVNPMWEQHIRTVPCWFLPILFIGILIFERLKKEADKIKFSNYICVVLICAIAQTGWQLVHDYYWSKNIKHLKKELHNTSDLLYIPARHEELSSFHNNKIRRYLWYGTYPAMSILLSDSYEIKTLLVNYDESKDAGNGTFREWLYITKEENKMGMPFGGYISIKNKFWDLTQCAKALDEYNKKNKIKTLDVL